MFWRWEQPNIVSQKQIGTCIKKNNISTNILKFSKKVDLYEFKENIDIIFECDSDKLLDVLPNSDLLLIVSQNLLNILIKYCSNDFDYTEVKIITKNKASDKKYFLLNILNEIHVIDKDKSLFKTLRGSNRILSFKKIVYNTDNIGNYHIARNADYHLHLLISNDLKNILIENNITGLSFS